MIPPVPSTSGVRLATRMSRMKASAVREILKVTERPDIISFAGGLPAAELFPVQPLAEAHAEVFAREGPAALQYSPTEGWGPLREWLAARLSRRGMRVTPEQVLITSGSQQGIDLASKVLLDAGDEVLLENPSYLAALQTFGGFEASLLLVPSDASGMDTDALEQLVALHRPRLIYLVPEFQNPTGATLPLERRLKLVEVARRHRLPIIEDNPYGELRYQGTELPPLAALDSDGLVIDLGTFSKTLAPGLRIGWAVGSPELIRQMAVAKQASDLHSSTLSQRAVSCLLETFDYDQHLARLRQVYGERCQTMLEGLARHFPEGTRWTIPDGGLFLWVELPRGLSGEALLPSALARKVAFVPGAPFYGEAPRQEMVRLNFSNRSPATIAEGMEKLGLVLREALARG